MSIVSYGIMCHNEGELVLRDSNILSIEEAESSLLECVESYQCDGTWMIIVQVVQSEAEANKGRLTFWRNEARIATDLFRRAALKRVGPSYLEQTIYHIIEAAERDLTTQSVTKMVREVRKYIC